MIYRLTPLCNALEVIKQKIIIKENLSQIVMKSSLAKKTCFNAKQ